MNDLSFEELRCLEQDMDNAVRIIRERKVRNRLFLHFNSLLKKKKSLLLLKEI